MRVKVIKEIKGLVPGDILYYMKDTDTYEINKTEYDISDSTTTTVLRTVIGSYIVENMKDYFIFIDDEDNTLEIDKIYYNDFPENQTVDTVGETQPEVKDEVPTDTEVIKLQEQVKELEKRFEDIERFRIGQGFFPTNPYRYTWVNFI
jgi:hypothetical protein